MDARPPHFGPLSGQKKESGETGGQHDVRNGEGKDGGKRRSEREERAEEEQGGGAAARERAARREGCEGREVS